MSNHEEVLFTQDVGGQFKVVGKIVNDSDPECPVTLNNEKSDYDCNGSIYRFERGNHLRNQNYHHIYENDPFALKISKYEHGNVVWSLANEGPQCTFDTTQHAGYWVCENGCRENYDAILAEKGLEEAQKWLREAGRSVLEEFTAWCNGDCWGVVVEVTPLGEETLDDDNAVWGYFGRTDAERELQDRFEGVVKLCEEKLATRRERALALIEDEGTAHELDDQPLSRYLALTGEYELEQGHSPEGCLAAVNASRQHILRFVDLDGDTTCGTPVDYTTGYVLAGAS